MMSFFKQRLGLQKAKTTTLLGLIAPLSFLGSALAQDKILEEKVSIPAGQAFVQSLHNQGEAVRLRVSVNSNSPVSFQVMDLRAHTLRKGGLGEGEGVVLERVLEESGSISGDFTAGEGSWWIHVENPANYPNQITLLVSTSDGSSDGSSSRSNSAVTDTQSDSSSGASEPASEPQADTPESGGLGAPTEDSPAADPPATDSGDSGFPF